MKATWDDERWGYVIDDEAVSTLTAKGASAGVARESKANLSILIQRLQNEQISLQEAMDGYVRETKLMHMAEGALAYGGIEQVKDWSRIEEIIATQWNGNDDFPGMRAFFEDIERGRYGTKTLSSAVLARGTSYAAAGRLTYENERLAGQIAKRDLEAKRVTGGVESHCEDCPAWARLGYIDARVMYEKYPIGSSTCNVYCYCVIVTRRKAVDAEQAVGWNALLPALQSATQVAGSGTAIVAALAIFRYAGRSPLLVRVALRLLANVLGLPSFVDSQRYSVDFPPASISSAKLATLKLNVPHPFTPRGTPIGRAIEFPAELQNRRRIMGILDRVHGDGRLKTLESDILTGSIKAKKIRLGRYYPGEDNSIAFHPQDDTPGLSTLHEVGHWLVDKRLGDPDRGVFADAPELRKAIFDSDAVKQLRSWEGKKTTRGKEKNSTRSVLYNVDTKHVSYLLDEEELLVRSYAQYIAMRSGDEQLQRELASNLLFKAKSNIGGFPPDSLHYAAQWDASDFEKIGEEWDKLLVKEGWMQRGD